MSHDGHPTSAKLIAFCASTTLLFLLLQALPTPTNEAELTKKVEASGGKIYRVRAGTPDKDGWYEAESTHRHFKVRLPAQFNDFFMKEKGGDVVEVTTVGTSTPDHTKWLAVLVTYKDADAAKKYFDKSWLDTPRGSAIRELTFRDRPAREAWVKGTMRSFAGRCVLMGNEQYALMVDYDAPLDLEADIVKFMNSLEFPSSSSHKQ